jgi:ribosome-binding factor A
MPSERRRMRMGRVNELVREVLAEELERLADPRLGFVTVTGVDVTADLRQAVVYYSVLGPGEAHRDTAEALVAASPHLRATLGRQVRLKFLPTLVFREDPAVAHGQRVEEIIRTLHDERSAGVPDDGGRDEVVPEEEE